MTMHIIQILLQGLLAFFIGTIVADVFHFLFHKAIKSKFRILKAIGHLHTAHHHFYTHNLHIDNNWIKKNFLHHVILEYAFQISGILCCLLFLNPYSIILAVILQTGIFINICFCKGIDFHHRPFEKLPCSRGNFFVSAAYHALHHVHPSGFYSSYVKLFDWIFGKGHHLEKKQIAMTGANGALGRHMKKLLEKEGAIVTTFKFGVDYTYDDYEKLRETLSSTDILFLCHGSKHDYAQEANCDSYIKIIEMFKSTRKNTLLPLEIWGVGSEIECHPCFGIKKLYPYANSKRNYARAARTYFHDDNIQYRHLVHSAFISPMGPGLMTANFAARMTMFFIKRDFKYIPVTYTGFAWLNYLRFVFQI